MARDCRESGSQRPINAEVIPRFVILLRFVEKGASSYNFAALHPLCRVSILQLRAVELVRLQRPLSRETDFAKLRAFRKLILDVTVFTYRLFLCLSVSISLSSFFLISHILSLSLLHPQVQ